MTHDSWKTRAARLLSEAVAAVWLEETDRTVGDPATDSIDPNPVATGRGLDPAMTREAKAPRNPADEVGE